jgi:hypothetical protein
MPSILATESSCLDIGQFFLQQTRYTPFRPCFSQHF